MTMEELEDAAAALVDSAIAGHTCRRDRNSGTSIHDFDLVLEGSIYGALEVVLLADRERMARSAAIGRYGGEIHRTVKLSGAWHVSFGRGGRVKHWQRRLEPLLIEFEQRGWFDVWPENLWGPGMTELRTQLLDLGVSHARTFTGGEPGSIIVTSSDGATAGGPDDGADSIGSYLASAECDDVVRKLVASGARERHAFVPVHFNEFAAWEPLQLGTLPTRVPADLPDEITDVWMARASPLDHAWWFSRDHGWRSVSLG